MARIQTGVYTPTANGQEQDRRRWAALVLLCLAQFMLILDITAVNVALPGIGAGLHLGREALTWTITAYTVCFGSLMILGGRLADALGARRTLLAGLVVFIASSATTGVAGNAAALIGGRVGQGIGAALMSPAALAIVTTLFRDAERAKALAVWGGLAGAGSALGSLLGGALTAGPGWRWIFYINLPAGILVLVALPALVAARPGRPARLDVLGALLVSGGSGMLIYALVKAGDTGSGPAAVLLPLAASAVLYGLFAAAERRASDPLLDVRMLARGPVLTGALLMLTGTGFLFGFYFLGSIYLQDVRGYGALTTGLLFLPVAVGAGTGAQLAGRLGGTVGARRVAAAALGLAAVGSLLLAMIKAASNPWLTLLPGLVIGAVGIGAIFVTATSTALANVPEYEAGLASAVVNTFHEVGGGIGVAVMSAVAAVGLTRGAITGFTHTFASAAVLAIVAAIAAMFLIPPGTGRQASNAS